MLNKDKKFEDDAIARFCCSVRWLNRFAQVETKKKHGNRFNNNIDREYLSVNNNNNNNIIIIIIIIVIIIIVVIIIIIMCDTSMKSCVMGYILSSYI